MKRYVLIAATIAALLVPATASAARVKYSGSVDTAPGSKVAFTIKKRDGKKKLVDPSFTDVPAECTDSEGSYDALLSVQGNGTERVKRNKFSYQETYPFVSTFFFDGKLKRGGEAAGTLEFFGDVQGGAYCETGEVPWSARKR